jgi:general secretion pathway protein H
VILRVGKNSRAFSLLELILVLAVLSVSLTIAVPNLAKGLVEREVRTSALGLAALARDLRGRALSDGLPRQLLISAPRNRYIAPKVREVQLPESLKIVSIDGGESVEPDVKRFYFFPNGSSLGGEIVIADNENWFSYSIKLEPLTGRVQVARQDRP